VSSPGTRSRFRNWRRRLVGCFIFAACAATAAADARHDPHEATAPCAPEALHDHVREQFARFVPLSSDREYFGFIYLLDGKISSAVARGHECRGGDRCTVNTTAAARALPKRARVIGEWHTHPSGIGSRALSADDVRGARRHRHIPCYQAYYSTPHGEIYAWDVGQTSVAGAMSTRRRLVDPPISPPPYEPERWSPAGLPALISHGGDRIALV
jgi:hypothetical protein